MKISSKQIIPSVTGIMALVFIYLGLTKFGFWHEIHGPRPGFVPTIIGTLLLAISLLALVQSFKEGKPDYPKDNWMVVLGGAAILACTYFFGLIISCIAYVVLWVRVYEKSSWKDTIIVTAVISSIAIGVFVLWLGVPFPKGIILDALMG